MADDASGATAAAGIGLNLSTGNLIGAALGAVGLGASLFGGLEQASNAKQQAQVSAQIAGLEGQENSVRQASMEAQAKRAQIETLRTAQRARALGVQAGATQTGSLTGSGVVAGIENTEAQGAYGLQGIANNLAFGRQMFGLDAQITQNRIQLAQLGGKAATDQSIASLGGSIMKAGPLVGSLFGK